MFKNKRKLDSKVRYQAPQFKRELKKARNFRRTSLPFSGTTLGKAFLFFRARGWRVVLGIVVGAAVFIYIVFVPNFLYVRAVRVEGVTGALAVEVEQQAQRYLSGSSVFFPRRNMFFVSKQGLSEYLTTTNAHVWKVLGVEKKWPATLVVQIEPRVGAFLLYTLGREVLVANDGTVLPTSEPVDPVSMLRLTGEGQSVPSAGQHMFTGSLLRALTLVKSDFTKRVELPSPELVDLVPVVVPTAKPTPSPHGKAAERVGSLTPSDGQLAVEEQAADKTAILDVPAQELRLHVPAYPPVGTPAFTVLLTVGDQIEDVLDKLHILLSKQSPERLSQLEYVDMRFPLRAYICLRHTPCATTQGN